MSNEDLKKLISAGEDQHVEFKSSFQKEIIETVVAFVNASGGHIFIGVSSNGSVVGTQVGEETIQSYINTIKQNTEPSIIVEIDPIELDRKTILIIQVDEYPIKPVSYKGRYFKRRQNSNHQMTPIEISDAHIKMTNSSWDYFLDPYHTINDIDEQKIKAFMKKAHVDDDIKNVYNKFELLRNDKISFGCYLLFNNNDKAMLTNIEIGRFQTETIIKDSKSIYGDIISQVDTVMEFIYKHINKAYIITGKPQRDERWDYPMDAIREIVINMIVHRDYRSSGHTTVKIFDDRIEFFNQGKLPEELTLDKIKSGQYKSIPRNLQIANIFKEAEIIEKYGSGIKRIIESFRNYGLREPLFEQTMGGISVMAYKETAQENQETAQENQETAQENQETAQENQETAQENTRSKIIKLIKLNAYITKDELRFELKKADGTIKEHLSKLKNDGIIKRIGSTKSGKWEVIGEK